MCGAVALPGRSEQEEQMDYGILGPLEARDGGRLVALGGDKQRALLAILLLHANEVVSAERLIDDLWGEAPPASALRTLHAYVSRLRKALAADGLAASAPASHPTEGLSDGGLVTRGHGYLLRLTPGELDLDRFRAIVEQGREALAAGQSEEAASILRDGLALWRGPPLADFTYEPFAQGPIAQLEELRLEAIEERVDADLTLGHCRELIADLRELVQCHPLRERLHGQLMLALYRAGRQAEALEVYQEYRRALSEQLGLEPGPRLKQLELEMLARELSLEGVSAARARGRAGGVPTHVADVAWTPTPLPEVCPFKGLAFFDRADAEYFCGRERLVSDLLARLVESTLVGILGPSGIGKSSPLRAGLLPALSAGALPGSASWRQLVLRPGERPCAALQRALGGEPLAGVLGRLSPGERMVIAVDQLEGCSRCAMSRRSGRRFSSSSWRRRGTANAARSWSAR